VLPIWRIHRHIGMGGDQLVASRELIVDLQRAGRRIVPASSGKPDEVEHYLDLLDARGLADEQELRDAGAVAVFHSMEELRRRLSQTPLG
jgi:hypothetical protein